MKITDEQVQRVIKELKVSKKHLDVFAEEVNDIKSQEACEINNGGIVEQVRFILENNGIQAGKQKIDDLILDYKLQGA